MYIVDMTHNKNESITKKNSIAYRINRKWWLQDRQGQWMKRYRPFRKPNWHLNIVYWVWFSLH